MQVTSTRRMLWDEENRLLAINDNGFVSNYWYDASGERTVKTSGGSLAVYVNGVQSAAQTETTNFTAYISPYLVVSNGGNYTKHVYIGSQRITSKLSNAGIFTTSPVNDTLQTKYALQTAKIKERFDTLGIHYNGTQHTGGLVSLNPTTTAHTYFYHPDHLGSSSLITDGTGHAVQHIQYVPFGEVFIEQRNSTWNTPYKFNGKELDVETGLYYYHARYYDPKTSVWLSVDPLAEKTPSESSYAYCGNNPIMFIDPDGRLKLGAKMSIGVGQGNIGLGTEWLGIKTALFGHNGYNLTVNINFDTKTKTLTLGGTATHNKTKPGATGFGVVGSGHETSKIKESEASASVGFDFTKKKFVADANIKPNNKYVDVESGSVGIYTYEERDGEFSEATLGIKKFDVGVLLFDASAGFNLFATPSDPKPSTTKLSVTKPSTTVAKPSINTQKKIETNKTEN